MASGLVLAQVALSLVLLVGAGLFLRSFNGLTQVPLGFERGRVLLAVIDARRATSPAARLAAYGASTSAFLRFRASSGPLSRSRRRSARCGAGIDVSGSALRGSDEGDGPEGFGFTDRPIPGNAPLAVFNGITSGWIATFGTPLLAGRDISERDGPGSPRVALVNQAFARKFLDGATPSATRFTRRGTRIAPDRDRRTRGRRRVPRRAQADLPTAYVPLSQSVDGRWWRTPP